MSKSSRIAIVDQAKCKPNKCNKECISFCPPQSGGKEVIKIVDIEDMSLAKQPVVKSNDKKKIAQIVESQCIGCNICVRKCPFDAIKIVNLPSENKNDIIHRYLPNGFRLYKLPILKTNSIIGILGENGVGKTTLINILSKQIMPNFEQGEQPDTKKILSKFRGTVFFDYLKDLYSNNLTISIKSQKIKDQMLNTTVRNYFLTHKINLENYSDILTDLEITHLLDNSMTNLSGGELQRVLCCKTICSNADVYVFDEPSNYLDIKQRLAVTKLIRKLSDPKKYVIVIDHDLSMLDYMADEIFIIYGKPGAFGIVSNPMTTLNGINVYLDGYIPGENVRFRPDEFNLKTTQELDASTHILSKSNPIKYLGGTVEYPNYKLNIPDAEISLTDGINVILGPNGTGKTTFIKYLAKTLDIGISYKEQTLSIEKYKNKNNGEYPTVNELLYQQIQSSYTDQKFISEVVRPLDIGNIQDRKINELSGGELQRVLVILCLGTPASIYLIDEPSANLDIEKRICMIKVIKRHILNNHKCGFIIEHDIMMAVSFAQEVTSKILLVESNIVDGVKQSTVSDYMNFSDGINNFLNTLNITMRLSGHNRPRINKNNSQLDKEQRELGKYYM